MVNLNDLHAAVNRLCEIVDQLGSSFSPPTIVRRGDGFVNRHGGAERTNELFCYLKAVKVCSTLNGILTLLDKAYVQEAYALARVAQDQVEDIHFLSIPRGESGGLSPRQITAINEFFQEEFEPADPVGTSRERDRVGRPKIQAAITNDMDDPSTGNAISRMIYRIFSGYVHGAYVHIMELHSDSDGHYQMHGAPAHLADAIDYAPNFLYQAILAVEFLIDRSSRDDLLPSIKSLRIDVASTCDVLPKKT
ncbi:MAG TPA: hypothetical protein VN325_44120 [Steroidobacteraceae bacterium]|nr:hypothetical protein [Steroidobacteraceae bacterium]